jgi:D-sedoheptulose 7-phosphate isomerase
MSPFVQALQEHAALVERLHALDGVVLRATARCADALGRGRKLLLCGNGGSAADCQHLAAELVGRLDRDRRALRAVALTTDSSALTAIANDYGYDQVFARQLDGLGAPGDVLLALSTSGRSPSVLAAVHAARARGIASIALTGKGGGPLADACDLAIVVPSDVTARIQEAHGLIGHALCFGIERALGLGAAAA